MKGKQRQVFLNLVVHVNVEAMMAVPMSIM